MRRGYAPGEASRATPARQRWAGSVLHGMPAFSAQRRTIFCVPAPPSLAAGGQPTTAATTAPKTRIVVNIFVPGTMVSFDDGPPKPPPLSVEIAPGKHKIRLTAPGYFDEERTIGVGEGEIAPANLPQRERPAELAVDTHDGAQISVDGRFVGEAPLSRAIDLPSGRHFIVVLDNGHETFTEDLEVVRGQKHTLTTDLATTTQRDLSFAVFVGAGTLAATGVVLGALAFERDAAARDWLDQRASRTLTRRGASAGRPA